MSKLVDHWNPDDRNQLFWLDDAFGVTQYEHHLVLAWNQFLPRLQPMLRTGATIVMTSRDYIYNRARDTLKGSVFPLLNESQVVIDVRDLEHFAEDPSAVKAIKYQEAAVDEWIFEYASGDSTAERPWSSQSTDVPTFGAGERSIFDDIDTECTRG